MMPETLLSPSNILLFGRVLEDLVIRTQPKDKAGSKGGEGGSLGTSGQLEQQLRSEGAAFARIYGYGQNGLYHVLPRPALFLVHGQGEPASRVLSGLGREGGGDQTQGIPMPLDDLRVWSYDKADYSIRMNMQSGTVEQLLQGGSRSRSRRGMSMRGMSINNNSTKE